MELFILIGLTLVIGILLLFGGGASSRLQKAIKEQVKKAKDLVTGSSSEQKEGIILYDNLLDKSLKMKGFKGETLADRLKSAKDYFEWDVYTNVWEAHKLRNKIVHESYTPSGAEIKKSVKYFTVAINRLLK